jgi:hypothetical protein
MTLIRKQAIQAHAVPNGYRPALGPFPREIYMQTKVVYDHSPAQQDVEEQDTKMFRCRDCKEFLFEDELNEHLCEEQFII